MTNYATLRKVLPLCLPALLAAPVLGLTGCASKTGTGAVAGGASGAVLGAGIGAIAGGNKGAVIGAGVGAATGAGAGALIGRYMDRQQQALEKQVKGAEIVRQGDQLAVKFDNAILFDTNRSELKAAAKRDLTELANVLKQYDKTNLVIEGHTDSTGTEGVNERLSWARAQAVLGFLSSEGVTKGRLSAQGYADDKPIASNDTVEGRAQNRRVQVQIAANEELKQEAAAAERASGNDMAKVPARAQMR